MAVIIVILILLGVAAYGVRRVYNANLAPVSNSQKRVPITVASGATTNDVAILLKQHGLIRQTWAFEWYIRVNNLRDSLKAGTYELSPSQSVSDIASVIANGKVATDLVTILPAQRLDQIKQAFVKSGFKSADVEAALNPGLYTDEPALADKPASASLEGYLYPDSFAKTADTKPETIIRESLELMQKHLTPDVRQGFVQQGLTVHQGIILASIVEQEVGKVSDKPLVAQVLLKRLHTGMPLGSDPTAFYGAIIAGKEPTLDYDSPYNTRLHTGLPPGPISNVSDSSLRAVVSPANTDYLYFVAGDDGVTHFSHTLAEHQAATQQYCKKLCNQ